MMLSSLFSKQKKISVLLVDIGSASVGTALLELQKGKPVRVIVVERVELAFLESLSSKSFSLSMNNALEKSLKAIHKKVTQRPDHILVTLSTPWLFLKTRRILNTLPKSTILTERMVDELINADIVDLKQKELQHLPEADIFVLEKNVLNLRLNGYEVAHPYGKKISSMDLVVVDAISSKKVVDEIVRLVGRHFHTTSIRFSSFPLAAFSAVRDMFPDKQNFLFIDITGESTDVTLVEDGILQESMSFPLGKNVFVRNISISQKTPHTEARSLLSLFLTEKLDTKTTSVVGETVHVTKLLWQERFEKTLKKISGNHLISGSVFFSCDDDMVRLFEEIFYSSHIPATPHTPIEINFLDQSLMAQFVSFDSGVKRDPFLGVGALLAGKLNLL